MKKSTMVFLLVFFVISLFNSPAKAHIPETLTQSQSELLATTEKHTPDSYFGRLLTRITSLFSKRGPNSLSAQITAQATPKTITLSEFAVPLVVSCIIPKLNPGVTSKAVTLAQIALKKSKHYSLRYTTQFYGAETKKAVIAFQQATFTPKNLSYVANGIIDTNTAAELTKLVAQHFPTECTTTPPPSLETSFELTKRPDSLPDTIIQPTESSIEFLRFSLKSLKNGVSFNQVDVRFADAEPKVLQNISFTSEDDVMAGETKTGTTHLISANTLRITLPNIISIPQGYANYYSLKATIPSGATGSFRLTITRIGLTENASFSLASPVPLSSGLITVQTPVPPSSDLTPRIAVSPGKKTLHINTTTGTWEDETALPIDVSIPNPVTSPYLYCQTAYPDYTITATPTYKSETISNWKSLDGSVSTLTITTTECRGTKKITPPANTQVSMCNLQSNDPKKLDVVFIPMNYPTDSNFVSVIEKHVDFSGTNKGILAYEPYKFNKNKFRFWNSGFAPQALEQFYKENKCYSQNSSQVYQCMTQVREWLKSQCAYDKAIIIFNNTQNEWGGWASSYGGDLASSLDHHTLGTQLFGNKETVHEFTHLMGLADVYVNNTRNAYISNPVVWNNYPTYKNLPNMDAAGCPKWCEDYVKPYPGSQLYDKCKNMNETQCRADRGADCVWLNSVDPYYQTQCIPYDDRVNIGLRCMSTTGCYHNADGNQAWRAAIQLPSGESTSLMFSLDANNLDLNEQRYLNTLLNTYE